MTPQQRRLFLEKYATGQHSPAEQEAFQRWLAQASGEELEQALTQYERLHLPGTEPAAPELLAGIEARLDRLLQPAASAPAVRQLWPRLFWVAAAVIGLLLLIGGRYFLPTPSPANTTLAYLHKRVPAGRTDSLMLPDGSEVVLNAGSTLSYPAQFTPTRRDVYLTGEGYFRVTKNAARPFVVHSGKLQTEVVGTSFNVYAYPTATRQEVTVLTGAVRVRDTASQQHVGLRPAQRAVFELATSELRAMPATNPGVSLAWRRGQLRFEDAPLDEVLDKLSVRYGVAIRTRAPRLNKCRLTVRFEGETLPEVLQIVAALTHSRYHTDSPHLIWLEGQGCSG
ncbi:FecR domain-containing protein [Hymenobacter tibetensis]|uniref:FecR domain-containing protein n=1 Tax=Hymenobacter tibetensis TaxID=497967 RepID=A0ABY4CWB6_9BACT|nr:FecR domain-containing protein [Hymenobacter tibetensis]UOG73301.1 FecR domain-containing protein [Hymenobacter tibetensis]